MLKKCLSVRFVLSFLLFCSIGFTAFSIYYKTHYWGFSFTPKTTSEIWTVEANISFEPNGEPIKISLAIPEENNEYKILEEDVVANGYKVKKKRKNTERIILTSAPQEKPQSIYYRMILFDNIDGKGKTKAPQPPKPEAPLLDEEKLLTAKKILNIATKTEGSLPEQLIKLFNQTPPDSTVLGFMPVKKSQKTTAETLISLLALKEVPARIVRGIKLEEEKKSFNPDIMLEAYIDGRWKLYNITTGAVGLPKNFVIFQRGGSSLIDVEGGENSVVKFSVIKSVSPSFRLASRRAKLADQKSWFEYSIYNLPLLEQNTLKWLSIFPLAILIIVLMRNVIGLQTMGTFTPMLLALSLVKTGLGAGLICFGLIITVGLLIRALLSKLNLLLVPRISSVVIFVILIMQMFTIFGHRFHIEVALSAVFFPIIIMAWIIERASITWEEDGAMNAGKEIFYSLLVAIVTYFVVSSEYIRHIMFSFNEINLVILFTVMLLGTYTGYRLTELKRFAPLVKG